MSDNREAGGAGLPGTVTETALLLPEGLSYDRWTEIGATLGRMHRACGWWVGDWINYGERSYGETYTQALDATGLDYGTLRNLAWAASRFELSRRRDNVPFWCHVEVAALPEPQQDVLLDQATPDPEHADPHQPRLSREQLRQLVRDCQRANRRAEFAARPLPSLAADVRLETADCAELPWPDQSVDLILTSPPYNLGKSYGAADDALGYRDYLDRASVWAQEMARVARHQGRLCLNVPLDCWQDGQPQPLYADWYEVLRDAGWTYRTSIVWDEPNVTRSVARGSVDSPGSPYVAAPVEMLLVMHQGEWGREEPTIPDLTHEEWLAWLGPAGGLWHIQGSQHSVHPATFPAELVIRLVKLFSFPGDIVLDPFLGSGTTAAVAHRLGRQAWGSDLDPTWIALAARRVAEEVAA